MVDGYQGGSTWEGCTGLTNLVLGKIATRTMSNQWVKVTYPGDVDEKLEEWLFRTYYISSIGYIKWNYLFLLRK